MKGVGKPAFYATLLLYCWCGTLSSFFCPAVFALASREIAVTVLAPVEKHQVIPRWILSPFLLGCGWPDWWFLLGRQYTAVVPLCLTRKACLFSKPPAKFPWEQFPSLCHNAYQCFQKGLRSTLLQMSSLVIMCYLFGAFSPQFPGKICVSVFILLQEYSLPQFPFSLLPSFFFFFCQHHFAVSFSPASSSGLPVV